MLLKSLNIPLKSKFTSFNSFCLITSQMSLSGCKILICPINWSSFKISLSFYPGPSDYICQNLSLHSDWSDTLGSECHYYRIHGDILILSHTFNGWKMEPSNSREGVEYSHIKTYGMIWQNGSFFWKKYSDMGSIFNENIPSYGFVFQNL